MGLTVPITLSNLQVRWGQHCEERGRALDRKNDVTRLYAKASRV